MCEFCGKTEVTIEKLDGEEQISVRVDFGRRGPWTCDQQAAYAVSEWYVEDHLCDAHKEHTEKEMEQGLADFLAVVGFGSQFEIRPTKEKETCQYIASSATDWKPCGKKASHAKYVLEKWLVCPEHATENGPRIRKDMMPVLISKVLNEP